MANTDALHGAGGLRRPATVNGARRAPADLSDIGPSDSASNLGHRRTASNSQRNGYERSERRTERTTVTTRDTLQYRSKRTNKSPEPSRSDKQREQAAHVATSKPPREEKQAILDWKPEAYIIPHTSAPLASRISAPPLANLLPEILEPTPLKELSSQEQEAAIIDDILYVFMGFEGQYIRFADDYVPTDEKKRLVGPQFRILPGLDPSLRDLTMEMLTMASYYTAVEAYIEVQSREEFGSINHALCASIRKLLKEYLVMVAQLEHQLLTNESFTLHVLHIHVMPTSNTMFQLYGLAQEMLKKNQILEEEEEEESSDDDDVDKIIERLKEGGNLAPGALKRIYKGGSVLRLLTERLAHFSGDPAARKVLEGLLRDASRPYMAMLNSWLHYGTIKDPHGEFLIREQKSINRDRLDEDFTDEYWEKRYTIRDGEIPPQLDSVKDKVLLAGKYLNVVRECGGVDISQEVADVPSTFDDPRFLKNVGEAYAHANASLLDLLLTKHELSARFRSLKHYYFLDRSDFFSYFLFLSKSELRKSAREVNVGKLQSLLDLVLRQPGSVAAADPYKEDVKVAMNDQTLTKFLMSVVNIHGFEEGEEYSFRQQTPGITADDAKMTGFDALEFKYAVPFPLSLVISSKTIVRYQILFRYLLSLRHVEGLLVTSWEDHNKSLPWTHRSPDRRLEMWKRRAWTLRGRMLNFIEQFTYYCTSEVIEPRWRELMAKINGVDRHGKPTTSSHRTGKTVDELMEDHVDFLDTCLKECMLMNPKLLKVRDKLMFTCTTFSQYTTKMSRDLCAADQSLAGTRQSMVYLEELYAGLRKPVPEQYRLFDPEALPKMFDMLDKYEENFNKHMKILLDVLDYFAATETVALSRLCAQLTLTSEKGSEGRVLV